MDSDFLLPQWNEFSSILRLFQRWERCSNLFRKSLGICPLNETKEDNSHTRQKFSFAFRLEVSTPISPSFRFSREVIMNLEVINIWTIGKVVKHHVVHLRSRAQSHRHDWGGEHIAANLHRNLVRVRFHLINFIVLDSGTMTRE